MTFDPGRTEVASAKLVDYLLNSGHVTGRHKASFFRSFGFTMENPDGFRRALLDHPVRNPVTKTEATPYGVKVEIRCHIETPDGRDPCILSVWMVKGDGVARLVTAYPSG